MLGLSLLYYSRFRNLIIHKLYDETRASIRCRKYIIKALHKPFIVHYYEKSMGVNVQSDYNHIRCAIKKEVQFM